MPHLSPHERRQPGGKITPVSTQRAHTQQRTRLAAGFGACARPHRNLRQSNSSFLLSRAGHVHVLLSGELICHPANAQEIKAVPAPVVPRPHLDRPERRERTRCPAFVREGALSGPIAAADPRYAPLRRRRQPAPSITPAPPFALLSLTDRCIEISRAAMSCWMRI